MTIGERIAEAAKLRGVNLHKLASMCNVSYNTLYSIVHRKSDRVPYDLLSDIANALNVSFEYLIGKETIDAKEKMDSFHGAIENGQFAEAERILGIPPGSLILVDESEIADEQIVRTRLEREFNLNRLIYCIRSKYKDFSASDFATIRDLIYSFHKLNDEGQKKAHERIEELAEIPKYQRQYREETAPAIEAGTNSQDLTEESK